MSPHSEILEITLQTEKLRLKLSLNLGLCHCSSLRWCVWIRRWCLLMLDSHNKSQYAMINIFNALAHHLCPCIVFFYKSTLGKLLSCLNQVILCLILQSLSQITTLTVLAVCSYRQRHKIFIFVFCTQQFKWMNLKYQSFFLTTVNTVLTDSSVLRIFLVLFWYNFLFLSFVSSVGYIWIVLSETPFAPVLARSSLQDSFQISMDFIGKIKVKWIQW